MSEWHSLTPWALRIAGPQQGQRYWIALGKCVRCLCIVLTGYWCWYCYIWNNNPGGCGDRPRWIRTLQHWLVEDSEVRHLVAFDMIPGGYSLCPSVRGDWWSLLSSGPWDIIGSARYSVDIFEFYGIYTIFNLISGNFRGQSQVLLKPKTTSQVSEILSYCNSKR